MSKFNSPLENLRVASPCSADWDEMYGDARKRFCADCKLNVYNLSDMTRGEAETLILRAEGRLCVRFYQRADGSVITRDCPVGWERITTRVRIVATAAMSLLMAVFTGVLFASFFSRQKSEVGGVMGMPLVGTTQGVVPVERKSYPMMGNIALPPPKPKVPRKPLEVKGEVVGVPVNSVSF
jgi:hypothetical protein